VDTRERTFPRTRCSSSRRRRRGFGLTLRSDGRIRILSRPGTATASKTSHERKRKKERERERERERKRQKQIETREHLDGSARDPLLALSSSVHILHLPHFPLAFSYRSCTRAGRSISPSCTLFPGPTSKKYVFVEVVDGITSL